MTIVFREYELLADSGLFDADFYIGANPDIAALNIDPLMHYLERGCREGRDPSAGFDTRHYLRQCTDIGETPANALLHYLTIGASRGLTPLGRKSAHGRGGELPALISRMPERARPTYTGQDTLASLSEPVHMEIDEAILCPPDGLVLKGWLLAAPGSIAHLRLCSGSRTVVINLSSAIEVDRADVIAAIGKLRGFSDPRCGFITYVASAARKGDIAYLEVELQNGEIGFKNVKLSSRSGLDAIERILEDVDVRYDEIAPAFDAVLGPAIGSINAARLREIPVAQRMVLGISAERPKFSIVIPISDRIDLIEYQMALFSRSWNPRQAELIYVLDDPRKRREMQALARSTFERYRIPFNLMLLPVSLGSGQASNVGLRAARGQYLCFMSAEAFPVADDWLTRLIDRLERQPEFGVVGPRLLYEDGSIRHEGCQYKSVPEFANWRFVEHLNEGRRPQTGVGLRRCDSVTRACMVMKRSLALKLGGFDEGYVAGELGDSDLCLKIRARDLYCAVDDQVDIYHLDSHAPRSKDTARRTNLMLFNAWVHERRWFSPNIPSAVRAG